MKYVLVSTFPREGTQNIGDKLIELSTADAVRSFDPDAEIVTVWRAEAWDAVRESLEGADHIVFACLAIRKDMGSIYPFLTRILDMTVPISVLAAGTNLSVGKHDMFNRGFKTADLDLLKRIGGAAEVFTTRGVLSQAFCSQHGLSRARFGGDVAFLDARFDERTFECTDKIKRIVISDPHHGDVYRPAFRALVSSLRTRFPEAQVECALHGVNGPIEAACSELGVTCHSIYRDPENGLDLYDNYDLHVGFRVHGHVSALKRRLPSYLLEQDGRGTDYGLTIGRKISLPCYRRNSPEKGHDASFGRPKRGRSLVEQFSHRFTRNKPMARNNKRFVASTASVELLSALIQQDATDGFSRFRGLELELDSFRKRTEAAVEEIVSNSGARRTSSLYQSRLQSRSIGTR
ncbi:polysaccharide pyruvyl transferase family protein [Thioalkalivibrio versutus]|uniref:polysaccharide pyruvyl transferase family protein n=1 Tax=Thioalkalivibrio versutus TaxID=106634 RepID=UPI0009E5A320